MIFLCEHRAACRVLAQLAATADPVPPGMPPAHAVASPEDFGLQAAANINPMVKKPKTEE